VSKCERLKLLGLVRLPVIRGGLSNAWLSANCESRRGFSVAGAHPKSKHGRARMAELHDAASERDWPAVARTYGEQHFSPLK
jgi:hypothetical protein